MTLILGPFVKFICGGCGRKIERQISQRRASQEIEDLRDGPKLYCAFCERFPSDEARAAERSTELEEARAEIARLQEAKRRALAVADERSKENAGLQAILQPFADWAKYIPESSPDALCIWPVGQFQKHAIATALDFRRAREALGK